MLALNIVALLFARLLYGDTSAGLPGDTTLPPQREFFYVGGEYKDVLVSHTALF
jgi:hypothetical protein